MNRHVLQQRYEEIPQRVRELSTTNPLVKRVIDLYIGGEIITKEEALCQMVVGLSKDWAEVSRRHFEIVMQMPTPNQTEGK